MTQYRLTWFVSTCIVAVVCGGCQEWRMTAGDEHVREIAKGWSPYRAPAVTTPFPAPSTPATAGQNTMLSTANRLPLQESKPQVRPMEQWDLPETAFDSLGRIGEPAVPALIQALGHPRPERRTQAARVLARIGPAARQAVPQLVLSLRDEDLTVQKAAARALGQIGPAAEQAVEPLLKIVEQSDE